MKNVLFSTLWMICISACAQKEETQLPVEEEKFTPLVYESEESLGENTVRINGFESHRDLDSMMPLNYLGKVEIDSEHHHTGDYSAKVTLLNQGLDDSTLSNPIICQSMYNCSRDVYETDVTNTKFIKMYVYNPQSVDYRIGMRPIIISNYDWIGGPILPTKWITVKANSWTEMSYEVNLAIIPESTEAIGQEVDGITHFLPAMYFIFNRPKDDEENRVFYLDDFHIVKKDAEEVE